MIILSNTWNPVTVNKEMSSDVKYWISDIFHVFPKVNRTQMLQLKCQVNFVGGTLEDWDAGSRENKQKV